MEFLICGVSNTYKDNGIEFLNKLIVKIRDKGIWRGGNCILQFEVSIFYNDKCGMRDDI